MKDFIRPILLMFVFFVLFILYVLFAYLAKEDVPENKIQGPGLGHHGDYAVFGSEGNFVGVDTK